MPCILICGTVTLSTPNSITETERVQALPRLPQDKGEPVFAEPWQAQAFALAVKLSEHGYFTWKEWTEALGDELNAATSRREPDDGSHYYDRWLAALEHLVTAKGLADSAALVARKEAWADAYRCTPHGTPVKLPNN
jgi:nitrile hydratase accessory protein